MSLLLLLIGIVGMVYIQKKKDKVHGYNNAQKAMAFGCVLLILSGLLMIYFDGLPLLKQKMADKYYYPMPED